MRDEILEFRFQAGDNYYRDINRFRILSYLPVKPDPCFFGHNDVKDDSVGFSYFDLFGCLHIVAGDT